MRAASFTVAAMRVRDTGLSTADGLRRLDVESLVQFHSVILVQHDPAGIGEARPAAFHFTESQVQPVGIGSLRCDGKEKDRGRHHPSCSTAAAFTAAEARFSTPSFT